MDYKKPIASGAVIVFTAVSLSHFHDQLGEHVETEIPRPTLPMNTTVAVSTATASTTWSGLDFIKAL